MSWIRCYHEYANSKDHSTVLKKPKYDRRDRIIDCFANPNKEKKTFVRSISAKTGDGFYSFGQRESERGT